MLLWAELPQNDLWRKLLCTWSSFLASGSMWTLDSLELAQTLVLTFQVWKPRLADIQIPYSSLSQKQWVVRSQVRLFENLANVLPVRRAPIIKTRTGLLFLDWRKNLLNKLIFYKAQFSVHVILSPGKQPVICHWHANYELFLYLSIRLLNNFFLAVPSELAELWHVI